jgi:hypothetical protein
VHTPALPRLKDPGSQAAGSPDPGTQACPAGQSRQEEDPATALYFPASHTTHASAASSGLYDPGEHFTGLAVRAVGQNVPVGHGVHCTALSLLYFPGPQPRGLLMPTAGHCVPAGQGSHVLLFGPLNVPVGHFFADPETQAYPPGHSLHLPAPAPLYDPWAQGSAFTEPKGHADPAGHTIWRQEDPCTGSGREAHGARQLVNA